MQAQERIKQLCDVERQRLNALRDVIISREIAQGPDELSKAQFAILYGKKRRQRWFQLVVKWLGMSSSTDSVLLVELERTMAKKELAVAISFSKSNERLDASNRQLIRSTESWLSETRAALHKIKADRPSFLLDQARQVQSTSTPSKDLTRSETLARDLPQARSIRMRTPDEFDRALESSPAHVAHVGETTSYQKTPSTPTTHRLPKKVRLAKFSSPPADFSPDREPQDDPIFTGVEVFQAPPRAIPGKRAQPQQAASSPKKRIRLASLEVSSEEDEDEDDEENDKGPARAKSADAPRKIKLARWNENEDDEENDDSEREDSDGAARSPSPSSSVEVSQRLLSDSQQRSRQRSSSGPSSDIEGVRYLEDRTFSAPRSPERPPALVSQESPSKFSDVADHEASEAEDEQAIDDFVLLTQVDLRT